MSKFEVVEMMTNDDTTKDRAIEDKIEMSSLLRRLLSKMGSCSSKPPSAPPPPPSPLYRLLKSKQWDAVTCNIRQKDGRAEVRNGVYDGINFHTRSALNVAVANGAPGDLLREMHAINPFQRVKATCGQDDSLLNNAMALNYLQQIQMGNVQNIPTSHCRLWASPTRRQY